MGVIETFSNEQELLGRVKQLKMEGIREEQMTVISLNEVDDGHWEHMNVRQKTPEGDTWDKIVSWFADEEPEEHVINDMGLSLDQEQEYKRALDNGRLVLHIKKNNLEAQEDRNTEYNYSEALVHGNDRRRREPIEDEQMELREERLNIDKEKVQIGEVGVNKYVDTEQQEFDVPVDREEVMVERRPVEGEPLADTYRPASEEGVQRIPITQERVRVIKERVVTEEIVIRKRTVTDKEHISEEVRKEDFDIIETRNDPAPDEFDNRRR